MVTKDVPDYALMIGNPARKAGWMSRHGHRLGTPDDEGIMKCPESGLQYKVRADGKLVCVDLEEDVPLPTELSQGTKTVQGIQEMTRLAGRVGRVKPSPTVALNGRVVRLKAEGRDIIGLGVGEPDFDTPGHIADAGVAAIRGGFTRYTAVEGIAELKDAIATKFRRDNQLEYSRAQILVSTGAKQTIFNMVMAVIEPGDEAVIPGALLGVVPGHRAARRRAARHALRRT